MPTAKQYSNELHRRAHELMNEYEPLVIQGKTYYTKQAHQVLVNDDSTPHFSFPREVFLPLDKNKWPKELVKLAERYREEGKHWPKDTHFEYAIEKELSKLYGTLLYAGYAVCDGVLYPTTFFVSLQMTREIPELPGEKIPEEWIIDPIAIANNKQVEGYVGIMILPDIAEKWMLARSPRHALNAQVEYNASKRT